MKYIDESTLPEPPIGAHLVTPRPGYKHHGLYIGNGKVIHYSGMAKSFGIKELAHLPSLFHYGNIVRTSLKFFCDGHGFRIVEHPHARFAGQAAVERAKKRLCERSYYFMSNNCEHFVNWCIEDEFKSPFITRFVLSMAVLLAVFQWLISGKAMHSSNPSARLLFGTLCAVSGAFASMFFTTQALQPADGMRGRERKNRYYGRIGMHVGMIIGVVIAVLGTSKKSRLALSLAPYFVPAFAGIGSYSVCRFFDTRKKEKIREQRKQTAEASAENKAPEK